LTWFTVPGRATAKDSFENTMLQYRPADNA